MTDIYASYLQKYKSFGMYPSISEQRFIEFVDNTMLNCLSIWISTWGFWEAILADIHKDRKIVATTIDVEWSCFSADLFKQLSLDEQIKVELQDISEPNTYEDNFFDLIYARLVLHYLDKEQLWIALSEIYRNLKPKWSLYIVIYWKSIVSDSNRTYIYDEESCLTTVMCLDKSWDILSSFKRYFHTVESISNALEFAGFKIQSIDEYQERLCRDYARRQPSETEDDLIEVIAVK